MTIVRSIALFLLAAVARTPCQTIDGFRPDRWDVLGALICLVGVVVIMYAPRPS